MEIESGRSAIGEENTDEATTGRTDPLAETDLFVRKSSGLVRELSVRDAFGLNIGGVNPTGIGFFFFVILASFPGSDLTLPIILAFLGAVLLSLTYSQLVATMPRSGADFVYISRIMHPAVGAVAGVAFLAFMIPNGGVNVAVLGNTYLPFVSQTLGDVLGITSLETFAGTLTEKLAAVITVAVICAGVALLLAKRVVTVARVAFWAITLGMVSVALLSLQFFLHGRDAFRDAFNDHVGNPQAYGELIRAAEHAGLTTGVQWSSVWSSLALAGLLYGGATFANYTGGELRRPGRTFRAATLICLAMALVLTLVAWLAVRSSLGLDFTQSAAYLSTADPEAYGRIAGDVTAYVPSYMLLVATDPVSKVIVAVGFAAGVFALILAVAVLMSRLAFALSFDRLLPAAVASVRPGSGAPVIAAVLTGLGLFGFAVLTIYTSALEVTVNSVLIFLGVLVASSVAAAVLPWARRDLYEGSPKVVGSRLLGVPPITIIGGLSALYHGLLFYFAATKTQVSGGYSTKSVLFLICACLAGLAAYVISRIAQRRRGLNLDLALRELPPE